MADNIQVNTNVGIDGNSILRPTISNDQLTNDDF